MKKLIYFLLIFICTQLTVYGQNKVTVVEPESSVKQHGKSLKRKVAISRFSNETQYAKGLFYDKENDPMGKQALDILSAKLAASNKFILLERSDLNQLLNESAKSNNSYQNIGADYLIIGSITEFGRKNIGDVKVFSTSKTQIVEAAVSVRLVDVSTGLIIYSEEAKGTAEQKTKQTLGVGGRADYDATLSDKAISMAISKLVENIINNCTNRPWKSYFLAYDNDAILISGGKSQGLEVGDIFIVKEKGKTVKNPQTGLSVELPGKKVGEVSITMTGGDTPETEYSVVKFTDGGIDKTNLNNYYIEEK
ncbi:CsgG/HfaB family protein [Bacteroides sedimenti]|uniref:Penicillin-binding protein activator LpoB n=1 Tax=Bacteroides sedimenti TaxID=2136147 RepID=A0ABM8II71_9BACE